MWFYKLDLSDLEYDTVNASIRHYIITDLLPVTNYTVTIYASNQRGNGKGSPDKNVFTLATVPAALSHLLTLHLTASSVQIEYTISPDTGGSPVTSLRIVYWADDEDSKNIEFPVTVPPQMNSYYLTGLKGDTLYFVRVSAGNLVGFGPETGRSFKTPIFVRVSDVGAMSIKLTWKVANVSQPYTEYHVYAMEDGSLSGGTRKITFRPDDVRRNALEETVEVTGLKDDTCYRFTVTIMNSKGTMIASLPSNRTCTLPCKDSTCPTASVGEIIAEDDSAQLIPILIVTIVVAILVVLVVVIVAILSRRYSRHRSSLNIVSSTNHDFTTLSLSSSHHGNSMEHPPPQSSSSSLSYPRQHSLVSQNSSSITDTEEAPATGSSVVSDNPFYFGNQDGSPQYQNRPHQYQNGAIVSVALCPNVAVLSEHPQTAGVKSMGSYPLFPIPENKVAMGHFEVSAPVIPNRPDRDATFMTDNPAFEKPQTIPISYNVTDTLDNNSEGSTPPPIPPYRGDSYSDTESNQPPPQIHVHTHVPPRSQSTQSVPCLGESYSQASRSPAMPQMPRTAFFLPEEAEDDEDDNTEFMENDAYESVSPKPQRREMFSQDSSTFVRSELKEPSYSKLSTSSLSRGRSLSPVFPRRGSTQSTASGNMPKFEIAKQQERGLVFETVNFKNHV